MSQITTAVVGVGKIGKLHARLYAEHPATDLAVVVDLDKERAETVASHYGNPAVETAVGTALERHDVDAVTVATPESHHLEPTREALARDCHVLLEKPIAASVADARAIGSLVDSSVAHLLVGYVCRFNPEYAALKSRIGAGELGDLLSVSAARIVDRQVYEDVADWTNPLYYLGVHDIDMLRWYVGAEVASVSAAASEGLDGRETPAVVNATLDFEDGTVGTLQIDWGRLDTYPTHRTEEYRLTGTQGYGELLLENDTLVCTERRCRSLEPVELRGRRIDMYRSEVEHFVECIQEKTAPLVTWEDGLRSLQIANAILTAIERDGRVTVVDE